MLKKNFFKTMKKLASRKHTANRTLPNLSEVVSKKWYIQQISPEFRNVFFMN